MRLHPEHLACQFAALLEINMVKHIVMWNVRGRTPEQKREAAQLVKTAFESLSGKIPGLTTLEVGLDVSAVDYACDVVLYTEFENQESLDAYASHPEHLRVKQLVGDVRIARHQVDYVKGSVTV
jgi:Stress responsive A/B Barrel Domain